MGVRRSAAGTEAAPDWRAAMKDLAGAYAEVTIRNWVSDFAVFEAWCVRSGVRALPADPEAVAEYVTLMFERLAASTIRNRINSIRRVHEALDLEDPTRRKVVWLAYRRGVREHGSAPRQAYGLHAALRDQLIAACPDTLMGLRDRLMFSLAYDTLCRRSELVRLRIEDVTRLPDGTGAVLVRGGKTDITGQAHPAYLSARTMTLLDDWLVATGQRAGPILRPVQGRVAFARAADAQLVQQRMRAVAAVAGVAPEVVRKLTSHSFRVGTAQDLARSGRTLLEIMRAGRWREVDSVVAYTRQADVNVWAPGDGDPYGLHASIEARTRRFTPMGRR